MNYIYKVALIFCLALGSNAFAEDVGRDIRTDAEWKEVLTPEQFYILRENGTEPPFSSDLHLEMRKGIYKCAACGLELFTSETKFISSSGWPSFWYHIPGRLKTKLDWSIINPARMMSGEWPRIEYHCARCDGHHGHLFEDGPEDKTGLRYCNNGDALIFVPNEGQ